MGVAVAFDVAAAQPLLDCVLAGWLRRRQGEEAAAALGALLAALFNSPMMAAQPQVSSALAPRWRRSIDGRFWDDAAWPPRAAYEALRNTCR